jgi:hypothetical protein
MTYIDDPNDPATILADAETFFSLYFADTDDGEVANVNRIYDPFSAVPEDPNWELLGRLAAALVQVYDLVLPFDGKMAERFLQRLGAIGGALLNNRDDMPHPPPPPPFPLSTGAYPHGAFFDFFRKQVMPAWGFFTDNRDGQWNTDVYSSGFLSYPMAAFARRVADHPARYAKYQDDAIRFSTAVIETYQAFQEHGQEHELHLIEGDPHAYFNSPLRYGNLKCAGGGRCADYKKGAGKSIAFNENLSMMQALAECALAADSALYRGSADATQDRLRLATEEMPLVVAKNVAFFVDNLPPNFEWQSNPPDAGRNTTEDLSHSGFLLGCLAVVLELQTGLNSLLSRAGRAERIPLTTLLGTSVGIGAATLFLRKIWHDDNTLGGNVTGKGPDPANNGGCAGFIPYAQFDQRVWRRSRDTTFNPLFDKMGNPTPNLNEANHGALLRYREFNSNSIKYLRDFAGQNWVITPAPLAAGESRPRSIHDQKWLLVLSGVVIADLRGEDGEWSRQTVSFLPDMAGPDDPDSTSGPLNWAINQYSIPKPAGSPGLDYLIRFSVEEWAPLVAPNAMFNESQAMNCGFAVDAWRPSQFGSGTDLLTEGGTDVLTTVNNIFSGINADLAVREKDAWLYRLGYRITLLGKIVFVATSPPLFQRPSFGGA